MQRETSAQGLGPRWRPLLGPGKEGDIIFQLEAHTDNSDRSVLSLMTPFYYFPSNELTLSLSLNLIVSFSMFSLIQLSPKLFSPPCFLLCFKLRKCEKISKKDRVRPGKVTQTVHYGLPLSPSQLASARNNYAQNILSVEWSARAED